MAWSKTKIALTTVVTLLVINSGVLVTVFVIQSHPSRREQETASASASQARRAATAAPRALSQANGFISLFNGADLTGWKYNTQVWSVVDGIIVGRAQPELGMQNHCLIWAGGEVDDFELHLKFRTTANANSGLAMRAPEAVYGNLRGYQAEIEGRRTGLLVIAGPGRERKLARAGWRTVAREENGQDILEQVEQLSDAAQVAEARRAVESGEWCDYVVIAQGTRVMIILNGVRITDTRDEHPTKFVPRGSMGLEYTHNPGREDSVEFKDIQFRPLTANPRLKLKQ